MKHSEIGQRIIETASSLFYKNGYNATGINEIISESGIAKATLYNHFRSKEDICIAYLRYKNSTFLRDIEVFADSKSKGPDQVLALFDFLQLFFQDNDFNGCWCIKTVAEIPMENQRVREEIQTQKNQFLQLIEELIANNLDTISSEQVPSMARKVYLLYESAIGESHLHKSNWPIQEARSLCSQIIS